MTNATRIRGVPADVSGRSTTARPDGLLSGVSAEDFEKQVETWRRERQQEYETGEMLDRELGLAEPEIGNGLHAAACADLRARGIQPDTASHDELLAAYKRAGAR